MRLDTVDVMLQTMNREWNILEGERDSVWSRKKNVKNKNTRWVGWRQPETKKIHKVEDVFPSSQNTWLTHLKYVFF